MRRTCCAVLLCVVLSVALVVTGCGGGGADGGGGGSNLRVLANQVVQAQQLNDGSFEVTSQPLLAAGGSPLSGYTWSLASGSAYPPGTTVSALTGVFGGSGAGLAPGQYDFGMVVSDGSSTASGVITLVVSPLPTNGIPPILVFQQPMGVPVIRLPNATANEPYGASLQVIGGVPPYTWLEDPSYVGPEDFGLSGLRIDQARGIVRGTPFNSAAGKTLRFKLIVTDNEGETAATDGVGPVYEILVQ